MWRIFAEALTGDSEEKHRNNFLIFNLFIFYHCCIISESFTQSGATVLLVFYFIFSTVFIFYEDKENLRKPQLSQKVISRPVLFQSYVRMTNALRTHDGSMTSFLYIAYTLSYLVYIRCTGP